MAQIAVAGNSTAQMRRAGEMILQLIVLPLFLEEQIFCTFLQLSPTY
jgi:hypothetical protein